jgi:hypothetical protein
VRGVGRGARPGGGSRFLAARGLSRAVGGRCERIRLGDDRAVGVAGLGSFDLVAEV